MSLEFFNEIRPIRIRPEPILLIIALGLTSYGVFEHVQRPFRLKRLWEMHRSNQRMSPPSLLESDPEFAKKAKALDDQEVAIIRTAGPVSVAFEIAAFVGAGICLVAFFRIRSKSSPTPFMKQPGRGR